MGEGGARLPCNLAGWDADVERKPRVVMAALIYAKREHIYQVESLSLMLTTDQWIPLEGLHELPLIEALQRQGRQFIKPLKYDVKSAAASRMRCCWMSARHLSRFTWSAPSWMRGSALRRRVLCARPARPLGRG
jgi:hypothetical protein